MGRHGIRRSASFCWIALLTACSVESAPPASSHPPSILLVTLDTTRADRIGAYGYTAASTPTIDRLASTGVLFETALAPTPITLPSHASILSGVAPPVHGVRDNGMFALGSEARLLPEALQEAGWRTGAFVGSYVLDAKFGLAQGFEVYRGPPVSRSLSGAGTERSAGSVVDDALAWIATLPPDERFFAWIHFYDPHEPFAPPPRWAARHRDSYDGEIAYCDEQLGRMLDALAHRGRDADLLVALTADHGESLGDHGEQSHGVFVYQATLHVPLVLSGAGIDAHGRRVSQIVGNTALAPTLLALAGLPAGALPAATGPTLLEEGPRSLYVESLLPYYSLRWRALRGLVEDGHKLIDGARAELYDLRRDPGERHDLAPTQPERVAALTRRLGERLSQERAGWAGPRRLEPGDRARLAALGYVAGSGGRDPFDASLPDPRARIGDMQYLRAATKALTGFAAVANTPPASTAWLNAERLARARRRLEAARLGLVQTRARNPGNFQLTATLGAIEDRLGNSDAAIGLLEEAARLQPTSYRNRLNLAEAYRKAGRIEDALRVAREIQREDPDFTLVYVWMSGYHAGRGEYGRAVGWMQALAERTPSGSAFQSELQSRLETLSAEMRARSQNPIPAADGPHG